MRLEITEVQDTHKVVFEINHRDKLAANFQEWDWPLLKECEQSNSIADKFLGLELIARRIEEGLEGS